MKITTGTRMCAGAQGKSRPLVRALNAEWASAVSALDTSTTETATTVTPAHCCNRGWAKKRATHGKNTWVKTVDRVHDKILKRQGKILQLTAEIQEIIVKTQLTCKHKDIAEAPYIPGCWGLSTPPFRVCCDCGFGEKGWNCGYQILTGTARELERECARTLLCGPIHPNRRFVRDGDIRDKQELYRRAVIGEPELDDE